MQGRRVGPPPMGLKVCGMRRVTINMTECESLAFVTLVMIEK